MKKKVVVDYIIGAFFELLKKNDVNNITISNVIEKSGVCRASFYRNFWNLEDVVRVYFQRLYDHIYLLYLMTPEKLYKNLVGTFQELLKEKENLILLEKRGFLYLLDDVVYQLCLKQMKAMNVKNNSYHAYYLSGASVFVTRAWIKNNCKESPEEMATDFLNYNK